MYIKKTDKRNIIKWYIRNRVNITPDINIDVIDNLKELENIVRTNKNIKNIFGNINGCTACYYDGRDFCKQCSNCKE